MLKPIVILNKEEGIELMDKLVLIDQDIQNELWRIYHDLHSKAYSDYTTTEIVSTQVRLVNLLQRIFQ